MNVNIQLDDEQNKEILNFNLDSKIFGLDYIKSLGKFMVQTRLDKDTCLNRCLVVGSSSGQIGDKVFIKYCGCSYGGFEQNQASFKCYISYNINASIVETELKHGYIDTDSIKFMNDNK